MNTTPLAPAIYEEDIIMKTAYGSRQSGKTTWLTSWQAQDPENRVIVVSSENQKRHLTDDALGEVVTQGSYWDYKRSHPSTVEYGFDELDDSLVRDLGFDQYTVRTVTIEEGDIFLGAHRHKEDEDKEDSDKPVEYTPVIHDAGAATAIARGLQSLQALDDAMGDEYYLDTTSSLGVELWHVASYRIGYFSLMDDFWRFTLDYAE